MLVSVLSAGDSEITQGSYLITTPWNKEETEAQDAAEGRIID